MEYRVDMITIQCIYTYIGETMGHTPVATFGHLGFLI